MPADSILNRVKIHSFQWKTLWRTNEEKKITKRNKHSEQRKEKQSTNYGQCYNTTHQTAQRQRYQILK